jgi:hypothetical protein
MIDLGYIIRNINPSMGWKILKGNRMITIDLVSNNRIKALQNILLPFLEIFDWKPDFTPKDIEIQEKQSSKRLVGVCYDACKYLAKKLTEYGIEYKSYWICGTTIRSILNWFSCETLHSFNVCKIPVLINNNKVMKYYIADCSCAYLRIETNEKGEKNILGFTTEREAIDWAANLLKIQDKYIIREFNPLTFKTPYIKGGNILYSLKMLLHIYKERT